jgi:hypothetical protein
MTTTAALTAAELDKLEARAKDEKSEGYALMALKHATVLTLIAQARAAEQAAPAATDAPSIAAWMTEDGERVVPAATMDGARRDGGAMLSTMRAYTVALMRAPAATSTPSNVSEADEVLALHRKLAGETLRANQGWERAEAKASECNELRERMAQRASSAPAELKAVLQELTATQRKLIDANAEIAMLLLTRATPASAQPAGTVLADLWMHEDMDRDAAAAAMNAPRKDLKEAHKKAVDDLIYWKRRALTAEASAQPVAAAPAEPVLWLEAEPSARGRKPHEVVQGMLYSTRIHTKCAPMTSNPVWPLYAGPAAPVAQADPYAEITLSNLRVGKLTAARIYVAYCELSEELKAAKGAIKRYAKAAQATPASAGEKAADASAGDVTASGASAGADAHAARYRWLRDQRRVQGDMPLHGDVWVVQMHQPAGAIPELRCAGFGGKLDRAIDAAMAAAQGGAK